MYQADLTQRRGTVKWGAASRLDPIIGLSLQSFLGTRRIRIYQASGLGRHTCVYMMAIISIIPLAEMSYIEGQSFYQRELTLLWMTSEEPS